MTYLAAMANDYENVYLYALNRIQSAKILGQVCRNKPGFKIDSFAEKQGHFGSATTIHFKAKICDHLAVILAETRLSENQTISPPNNSGFREITGIM